VLAICEPGVGKRAFGVLDRRTNPRERLDAPEGAGAARLDSSRPCAPSQWHQTCARRIAAGEKHSSWTCSNRIGRSTTNCPRSVRSHRPERLWVMPVARQPSPYRPNGPTDNGRADHREESKPEPHSGIGVRHDNRPSVVRHWASSHLPRLFAICRSSPRFLSPAGETASSPEISGPG
jgi:hypothetical protein